MPRGHRKRGEFEFTIWFEDGARIRWKSTRSQTDTDIASAIRRYLLPVAERIEAACTNCGHVEAHNGPAGDVADACTHPGCNCGYDSRGDRSPGI